MSRCSSPLSICWPNLFGRGGGKDGGQRDSAKSNSAVEQNKSNQIHHTVSDVRGGGAIHVLMWFA